METVEKKIEKKRKTRQEIKEKLDRSTSKARRIKQKLNCFASNGRRRCSSGRSDMPWDVLTAPAQTKDNGKQVYTCIFATWEINHDLGRVARRSGDKSCSAKLFQRSV